MSHNGIIIGAGIAGLATAIFARRQGLSAEVYERASAPNIDDHLIWIAPNGMQLLAQLGLAEDLQKCAVAQDGMIFSDRQLKPLMTLRGSALRQSCGFPIVALRRHDLWHALNRLWLDQGGITHYSASLSGIKANQSGIELSFDDDRRPITGSWLIGADGMGSVVRSHVAPSARIAYQGIRTWLGQAETPVAARFIGQTIEAWGSGTRFVLTSLDGKKVYFSALERPSVYESNAAPIAANTLFRLQKLFAEYHTDVAAVLAAADPGSLIRCNFGVVVDIPSICRGRLSLVGDAAHGMPPNMGQGASLALEDAMWVTHELSQTQDPALAFVRYNMARYKRVGEMRRLANAMNDLFQPQSRWAQSLRDTLAPLVPDRLTARRMGGLYQAAVPRPLAMSVSI